MGAKSRHGITLQREFMPGADVNHHSYVSPKQDRRLTVYTIERHVWLAINQNLTDSTAPITVIAVNDDAGPITEMPYTRTVTLGQFPNSNDGWQEANQHAQNILCVLNLLDRADTNIDHWITASRAILHDVKGAA